VVNGVDITIAAVSAHFARDSGGALALGGCTEAKFGVRGVTEGGRGRPNPLCNRLGVANSWTEISYVTGESSWKRKTKYLIKPLAQKRGCMLLLSFLCHAEADYLVR
jgi:hypothetical protein